MRRALQLLRLIALHQEDGLKLSEVIAESGLERSTVHRLLSCLVEEQFVEKAPDSKSYRLGIDAMQLGFASMRRVPLVDSCRALMQKLARMSGDTVFLVVRQGDYCVCLHREEGHFPVRVFTTDVGDRRLLGIGAGGLALMATIADGEIDRILERHASQYQQAGFTQASLMSAIRRTRGVGYSEIVSTITEGVSGIGRAFWASSSALAAISFGAISTRLEQLRRQEMGQLLIEQLSPRHDFSQQVADIIGE